MCRVHTLLFLNFSVFSGLPQGEKEVTGKWILVFLLIIIKHILFIINTYCGGGSMGSEVQMKCEQAFMLGQGLLEEVRSI